MSGLHKDFHGYHNFILQWVEENYGEDFLFEGLRRIGRNVYSPVAERLAAEGLKYLAGYWKDIFECEEGDFQIELADDLLTLKVNECPAISYLHSHNRPVAKHFCEHTRIVNEEICRPGGFDCSVEYDREKGCCVQKYWPKGSAQ